MFLLVLPLQAQSRMRTHGDCTENNGHLVASLFETVTRFHWFHMLIRFSISVHLHTSPVALSLYKAIVKRKSFCLQIYYDDIVVRIGELMVTTHRNSATVFSP
jgi:hypothetical protein